METFFRARGGPFAQAVDLVGGVLGLNSLVVPTGSGWDTCTTRSPFPSTRTGVVEYGAANADNRRFCFSSEDASIGSDEVRMVSGRALVHASRAGLETAVPVELRLASSTLLSADLS